ncbi:MAG UNVERIFIED_CONTAM: cupin domain-containing protein [Microcystis novacekii LVE1205-3]|jgi:hypothetical protein
MLSKLRLKKYFVIEGTWRDELGSYPVGSWLRSPQIAPTVLPQQQVASFTLKPILLLIQPHRFVVGDDFQHPQAI